MSGDSGKRSSAEGDAADLGPAVDIGEDVAMDNANVLNPVLGVSVADLARTGLAVLREGLLQPTIGLEHAAKLTQENIRIIFGKSELLPDPRDRRFADPAFTEQPVYRRVAQSWLALQNSLQDWSNDISSKEIDRKRASFITQLLADAVAPTNTLVGNPSAIQQVRDTRGASLWRGTRNLLDDVRHNGGMPKQVDTSKFRVGENLALTKGSVVFEHPILELIQYASQTSKVRSRPIFVVPPQINKFYLYDLAPGKSMVEFLVQQGFRVFVVSWRNTSPENRDWGLAEYIEAIEEAIDATCEISRQRSVDGVGACAGGTTFTSGLAYWAALGRANKVASLTLMVNVLETHPDDSDVGLFATDEAIEAARKRSAKHGVLDGRDTARVFNWMRPNDLIWNYVGNNYLHGQSPPAFDVLYWNNDTTRMPARLHSDFLDVFKDNPFSNPGAMSIRDVELDLRRVTCPVFITGGSTDHITPWHACYRSTQLFGGNTEYLLSTAGHIQSILNPPGPSKRRFYTNNRTPPDHEEWFKGATEHAGSWWPYWANWLRNLDDTERNAPRKTGTAKRKPIRPAPGHYVLA